MAGVLESVREDDFVEYYLFLEGIEDIANGNKSLESKLSTISSIVAKYTKHYIWHKDDFNIIEGKDSNSFTEEIPIDKGFLPSHLYGITYYGDNLEDEWFIVFLLLQLTKEINGLVVRVVDADGEFLLIEAADALPKWANPNTCEQRVYLYQGKVHIIPLDEGDGSEEQLLLVTDAISCIRHSSVTTEAPQAIQDAIHARVNGYPGKITDMLHRTSAFVPVGVAALLHKKPSLISAAVLAFCNRDPIDMKACRAMRYFPPENRVMTSIVFTKLLYAMLSHHKFSPDRCTGWNMPSPSSANFKAHNLGMKLACGFEILVAQSKPAHINSSFKNTMNLPIDSQGWHCYLNRLKKIGYFQGLMEGSKDYNSLIEKAQEYFTKNRDSVHCKPSFGQEIVALLNSLEYDTDELKKAEASLPPPDDEKWLELCPKDLDTMLEERYGPKKFTPANSNSDPASITTHLAQFLNHISGLEGAEFPRPEEDVEDEVTPPVRPKRGIKLKGKNGNSSVESTTKTAEEGNSNPGNRINFDPEAFSCAFQNILDFAVPEDSWDLESDGSGMSSYEDEMEMDLDQLKSGKKKKSDLPQSELKQYMDQMDHELAGTTIGQSFETSCTNIKKDSRNADQEEDSFDDIESFQPVDIDMNALKNILKSYQSQMGAAGPASNLLGPMGIKLEPEPQTSDINKT